MDNSFFVSVIMPVLNGERFIGNAIQSILDQSHRHLEIIVVDDGSTDDTQRIVQSFGDDVQCLSQENQGPAKARNTGLKAATGNVIGFLDADDLWPANRLQKMLKRFEEDSSLEIIMGHTQSFHMLDASKKEVLPDEPYIIPQLGSTLIRKSVFSKIGAFDPSLRFSEDQDFFLRAKERGIPLVVLKQVTLILRKHAQNMTREKDWKDVDIIKVLKKSLDRRKQDDGSTQPLPKLSDFEEKS